MKIPIFNKLPQPAPNSYSGPYGSAGLKHRGPLYRFLHKHGHLPRSYITLRIPTSTFDAVMSLMESDLAVSLNDNEIRTLISGQGGYHLNKISHVNIWVPKRDGHWYQWLFDVLISGDDNDNFLKASSRWGDLLFLGDATTTAVTAWRRRLPPSWDWEKEVLGIGATAEQARQLRVENRESDRRTIEFGVQCVLHERKHKQRWVGEDELDKMREAADRLKSIPENLLPMAVRMSGIDFREL